MLLFIMGQFSHTILTQVVESLGFEAFWIWPILVTALNSLNTAKDMRLGRDVVTA